MASTTLRLLGGLAASLALLLGCLSAPAYAVSRAPADGWTMGGHDYADSRSNPGEHGLTPATVGRLSTRWTRTVKGDVSATPAVAGNAAYVPDWGGYFWKLDARTGRVIWSRQISEYVGISGATSRTSPAVVGNTVYLGTQEGAWLLAIDASDGALRWRTQLDTHPYAVLTQSPVVYRGVVYEGVSSGEEGAAGNPGYQCCTFRGSLVAASAATGRIRWKSYLIPDQGSSTDVFSGAAVWSGTPAIDPDSGTVYITTGNNYEIPQSARDCRKAGGTPEQCLPDWNTIDSIVAFDLRTGARKWSAGSAVFDAWNSACLPGIPPNNCPADKGADADFADGAHLFLVREADGRLHKAVGAGQKSGVYWMVDAATGKVLWSAAAGPGGSYGGLEWGTATDGKRIYFTESDSEGLPYTLPDGRKIDYSSFGALDPATGKVLWQIPEPHGAQARGAVSTAGGVVYAGSLNGSMYALDARTGALLWQFQGQGASNAGPAVAGGTVYWGNGYTRWGQGTGSTTFYAFSPSGSG